MITSRIKLNVYKIYLLFYGSYAYILTSLFSTYVIFIKENDDSKESEASTEDNIEKLEESNQTPSTENNWETLESWKQRPSIEDKTEKLEELKQELSELQHNMASPSDILGKAAEIEDTKNEIIVLDILKGMGEKIEVRDTVEEELTILKEEGADAAEIASKQAEFDAAQASLEQFENFDEATEILLDIYSYLF